ncbi:MAG: hypothetical protein ACNI27_07160 [Desulfovibrio sp.]
MSDKIKDTTDDGVEYVELEHEFMDRFKGEEVTFTFRFKRPNTAQANRFQKTCAKNSMTAGKNLVNDTIHPEDKAAFKNAQATYPGLAASFGNELATSCGFGTLGN